MTGPRTEKALDEWLEAERLRLREERKNTRLPRAASGFRPSERFTGPGQALAALRAKMRAKPGGPEPLYRCGVCQDTGWQEIDAEGRGTVQHCPRGCEIPKKRQAGACSRCGGEGFVEMGEDSVMDCPVCAKKKRRRFD